VYNFFQWHDGIIHEEKPLPTDLESLVNEFLKYKNSRGEIPYGHTVLRNFLAKSNEFHS
jgi:hypothetical protein